MLELSLEQQLELARRTYPGRKVSSSLYGSEHRVLVEMEGEFKPSLTGNQQYRAQACDVIVAALNLPQATCEQIDGEYRIIFDRNNDFINTGWHPNLLHASALALLGDKT